MNKTLDPYGDLQIAIVRQAVDDYEKATFFGAIGVMRMLKKWFYSDWGQTLCNNNGERVEKKARKNGRFLQSCVKEGDGSTFVTVIEVTPERDEMLKAHGVRAGRRNGFYTARGFSALKRLVDVLQKTERNFENE